jgi:ATP-dependent RNA helicase DDX41
VLRDLKALLIEARQKVPPFLFGIDALTDDLMDLGDDHGCAYCSGLGHRITNCPKLEAVQQKQAGTIGRKDYLASSAADW